MAQLDILKIQLKKGIFPHAYLFLGNSEELKNEAIELVALFFLGKNYKLSPDFHEINKKVIIIDDMRYFKNIASSTPLENAKNIFLIREIQSLSRDAAPSLLKFLEEPAPNSIILATTKNKNIIPKTILSRFSKLRLVRYEKEEETAQISKIKKLSLKERFLMAEKIVESGEFDLYLKNAILGTRRAIKEKGLYEETQRLENFLKIKTAFLDPTVNKRMLWEYFAAII